MDQTWILISTKGLVRLLRVTDLSILTLLETFLGIPLLSIFQGLAMSRYPLRSLAKTPEEPDPEVHLPRPKRIRATQFKASFYSLPAGEHMFGLEVERAHFCKC